MLEYDLNTIFNESLVSKREQVNELLANTITKINIETSSTGDLLNCFTEFNKIFKPKNYGDLMTILNPHTGMIDDQTAKLLYTILDQIKNRIGKEQLVIELSGQFK